MRVLCVVFLLLVSSYCSASQTVLTPPLIESLNQLNDAQLLEAYSSLQTYVQKNPDDPAGTFLFALTKWRIMWISNYTEPDRQELTVLLERVEQLCEPQSEKVDCSFFNAAVTGIYAQVAATENRWWETAQLGKKMKNQAQQILETDEQYYPAKYLLGSFNYFADALPGYMKFLRTLVFLPSGNRAVGLQQLNDAYTKGGVVSGEAGRTLALIYTYYEHNSAYGEQMCDILLRKFPEAYDVQLYRAINLYFDQSWRSSLNQLHNLRSGLLAYSSKHESSKEAASLYRPLDREARYWIGRNLIQMENYGQAKDVFTELANPPLHQPYWLIRWVYLSLAQIEYHNQNDEAAEAWIEKVLAWKDVKDSTDKAKLLRKKHGQVDTFDIDVR